MSEDDLHLFEIPEPPTVVTKNDNRSSIGSGSAITTEPKPETKAIDNKSQTHYQQSQSSTMYENDALPNAQDSMPSRSHEEKSCINHMKNVIQKLERVNKMMVMVIQMNKTIELSSVINNFRN